MDFKLDDYGLCWTAKAILPSWRGYLDRSGAYGGGAGGVMSDGSVDIVFAPEGRDTAPLTQEELALARWLIKNEHSVSDAVKLSIFNAYGGLQEIYEYDGPEKLRKMPDISSTDDLKRLVGLHAVNVHQVIAGDVPYLGFEFGCTWDDEHGLGVLMHGERVVKVGGAETAILLWIAEKDAAAE